MRAEITESWLPAIAAFKRLFAQLSPESVAAHAGEVYAEGVHFDDTLRTIDGRERVVRYLRESARRVKTCTVEFDDVAAAIDGVYVRWRMRIVARGLAGGRPIDSIGMTHLRFDGDGKVVFQQDYWDSGSNLLAHIPVIGWTIRRIKALL